MNAANNRVAGPAGPGPGARQRPILPRLLMAGVLFVSVFTSGDWLANPASADGEVLRLDTLFLFGQVTIYHLLAALLFAALFFAKFAPDRRRAPEGNRGEPSFLKTLFWLFFVPLNILIYLTVAVESIRLQDLGVAPVIQFGTLLVVLYFIQDVYLRGATAEFLTGSVTMLQVLITVRCAYTIGKYLLGRGMPWSEGGVRLGQENDLADFFVLLFVIALTRLLFETDAGPARRAFHLAGAGMALAVAVVSERRYFQWEVVIALGVVLMAHLRVRRGMTYRRAIGAGLTLSLVFGVWLFVGPARLAANSTIGRFLTSFSLVSERYAGRLGTDTGHQAEIRDGWLNVRAHWLLGVTPFGAERIRKVETREWQEGYYVHNAYLWVWMIYGLFGLALFLAFYGLSSRLGWRLFARSGDHLGLILGTFLVCQMVKNIVWLTAFHFMNVTIVYLFLVSLAWKAGGLEARRRARTAPVRVQGVSS
jgi:hypothetical protein